MLKRIVNNIKYFVLLLFVVSLIRNSFEIVSTYSKVEDAKSKLEEIKKEKETLLIEQKRVSSEIFREKQARDKLGLAKKGEIVVVLPNEDILRKISPRENETVEHALHDPIWKKWIRVLFS